MSARVVGLASRSVSRHKAPPMGFVTLIPLAIVLSACQASARIEPRFDPNIDYGQIEAGSFLRLEVGVMPAGMLPPEVVIEWSVDTADVGEASTSSLRALPGTPGAIEYRPPAGARGPVVVRAELRTEDCAGDARASRACSAEFALNVVAPEPPTLRVFVGGNEPGEFLLQWTAAGTEAIRWQYRYRPRFERTDTGLRRLASWGDWMDVPHSDSDTRNHRVTGLLRGFHVFQVEGVDGYGRGNCVQPGRGPRIRTSHEGHRAGARRTPTRKRSADCLGGVLLRRPSWDARGNPEHDEHWPAVRRK